MRKLLFLVVILSLSMAAQALDAPLRFISLPGAGVAGLVQIRLMQEIQNQTGRSLHHDIKGIAGTSAGAIIASMPCTQKTPGSGPIFDSPTLARDYIADASEIMDPTLIVLRRSDEVLDAVLAKEFGSAYLSQSLCHVMIDAYNRNDSTDVLFDSIKAQDKRYDLPVWEAIRASSSIDLIPLIGFPFSSGSVQYNTSEMIGGFSDPGLHRESDPTGALLKRIAEVYPNQEAVVYVFGAGQNAFKTEQINDHVTVVRIEPDFYDAAGSWTAPFKLDTSARNIAYIEARAEELVQSERFKEVLRDFPCASSERCAR